MLRGKSHRELIELSKVIIQPLLPNLYKGQAGKVAVIGGCEDYTGAPYFASSASALIGSDLTHVICEKVAAPIIKSYSPDLMVHPYLFDTGNPEITSQFSPDQMEELRTLSLKDVIKPSFKLLDGFIESKVLPKVLGLIDRCDIFIIGPGFGRDSLMVKSMIKILEQIKVANKPVILDADALFVVSLDPTIIQGYKKAILTPNLIEFERIASHFGIESILKETRLDPILNAVSQLSTKLGVTVMRKSNAEIIVDGENHLINDLSGSARRIGGQGDTLTGCLATFVNWSYHYQAGLWDNEGPKLNAQDSTLLACYASSAIVRLASRKAFKRYGRAMQTSDIQRFLGEAYTELYDSEEFIKV
ncbi:ADP-dependent NAD(P)H-hydrate dehydratase [Yamadazyma tenuis]|uniref:ATP-dependent (S)-NAD(P)H-hydrate dehydratase n=1 Tax=Candida tenuis (strain ATCC 10573 / BCRC 21748 / CBS 615 / JCM 9827 / NBRC 10315 / NRRL Y-1498 / VKM Y-70) TaxID=590646 RepID=G3B4S9_CANTC|nr:Ribokinase-like protein [Yamadazyma tenuis ATCC 10573]XP_006686580.1 uncharacterized protein CANTEDRAFT_113886 [Yamadazyma tenuis ATCC 10573]EGV64265.1 Ribokinase-like protein [Yamadazyma tenuis ATCC 10573]EGV64266.1 hypothetical protein CANTEDRAFT_113886 [Yamadazyma tenuis ATCC 10573]WEJ96523.1 ADP-dependent NAD(P)H-hydrate dehydratase [Yamadazyma tenuis]